MNSRDKIKKEEGSGNIFADLKLAGSDELFTRAQLGYHVYKLIKDRGLKQREAANLLGIAQPEVSHLMNGHFSRFTTDKILNFLRCLDQKVEIQISPHEPGQPFQAVRYAA